MPMKATPVNERALHAVGGCSAVEFDDEAETTLVRFDDAKATLDQILAVCEGASWRANVPASKNL